MSRFQKYTTRFTYALAAVFAQVSITMAQSTFHVIDDTAAPEEVLEAFSVGTTPDAGLVSSELGVSAPDDGGWNWIPTMVSFELNSSRLNRSELGLVDTVGKALARDETLVLVVSGHTDSLGSNELNDRLSYERAQAVATYLSETYQIAPARLMLRWRGAHEPLPGLSPRNPLNRRVQFGNRKLDAPERSELLESDTRAVSDLLRLLRDGKNPNE